MNKVIFVGYQSDIGSWLSAMDIFIFPSLCEGLGMSLVEAQLVGLKSLCYKEIPDEADIGLLKKMNTMNVEKWIKAITDCSIHSKKVNKELYNIEKNVKILEEKYLNFNIK